MLEYVWLSAAILLEVADDLERIASTSGNLNLYKAPGGWCREDAR